MRAAPLKGDCLICQAPEPTRVAINAVIWPGDGMVRGVGYIDRAAEVGKTSGVPALARLNRKTVLRHAGHVEDSWAEITTERPIRPGEAPVSVEFADVMDANARVGMKATGLLEQLLDNAGQYLVARDPKLVVAIAHKLGVDPATRRETSRLKRNQQAIDVAAIFGLGSGHVRPPRSEEEQAEEVDGLRAVLVEERRLLAERAGR